MACDEQAGDIDAADAAANVVGVEDGLPEKLLAAADFYCGLSFGGSGWHDQPDGVAGEEVHLFGFIVSE